MAPCDFWAFPKVKKPLKNIYWVSIEEIELVTTQALKALTQEEFEDCFRSGRGAGPSALVWEGTILKGTEFPISTCGV